MQETQHFARWIRVIVALPVVVAGAVAIGLVVAGAPAGALASGGLAVAFAVLAVPNFVLSLVTTVDAQHVRLRLDPLAMPMPFLPPRDRAIPLAEISRCEVRRYRPLVDREYWGTHVWGLGTAFRGGAFLYVMQPSPLSATGVELELRGGERILVGSSDPEALADAIVSGPAGPRSPAARRA